MAKRNGAGNGKGTSEILEAIASLRQDIESQLSSLDARMSKLETLLTSVGTRLDNALFLTGAHYNQLDARVLDLEKRRQHRGREEVTQVT